MERNGQKYALSRLGNYQLTGRCLGKGSFAKVYEATHRLLNTKVALKTMNITEMKDNYMKKHFKREAVLLSQLNHPAIVTLFEVIETKNHYCIALEFGGENLCDFVRAKKRGRLDEITARTMARQLASAVSHLHERGIVHRDIKLENIMVNATTKKVKLADFGLSNSWDKKTMLQTHCGSPEYAAPELHSGKPYGFEVDVWALGVVLFGMVVGRLPFEVEMKKPVSNQHRRELFLDETKRGVKTMKHQIYMGSSSFLFKDLVSKMLNPARTHRLKIQEIEKHPWILGVFVEEFPPVEERWRRDTVQRYAKTSNLSAESVVEQLSESPYGQLGGMFNIEKHQYQTSKISFKKAPSCCKIRDIKNTPNASTTIHRPTTSTNGMIPASAKTQQRPKTARDAKSGTLKPFDSKLR